jgi:hypothetical protein
VNGLSVTATAKARKGEEMFSRSEDMVLRMGIIASAASEDEVFSLPTPTT